MPPGIAVPEGIDVVLIGTVDSVEAYSQFILKSLLQHVATAHVLIVQWDGYVVNANVWEPSFLECDYLGAVWPWAPEGMRVGNGGFSLRSRRLLEALQDPRIEMADNEDATICRTFRPLLECAHNIQFGSEQLAERFSFEQDQAPVLSGRLTFGFHGIFNFPLVEPSSQIVALAPRFSDAIARSQFCEYLLLNCEIHKQWDAVIAVGSRILAADPESAIAADRVVTARARLEEQRRAAPLPHAGRAVNRVLRWMRGR